MRPAVDPVTQSTGGRQRDCPAARRRAVHVQHPDRAAGEQVFLFEVDRQGNVEQQGRIGDFGSIRAPLRFV
jgi:hypothetical protein